jgi:MarR family transcriptional regulator, organic hydroperoxide resistance regulator
MGTIRGEIRQTRPFTSLAEEAVVTLVATADRVRDRLSQEVASHGITLQQYNVLRILRGAGVDGLPTLEIAARMVEKSPGITRLLDRLEAHRLVRRVRCPRDRRQVLCHSTAAANRLLSELGAPMAQAAGHCLEPLDRASALELVRLLDSVRAASAPPAPSNVAGERSES